MASPVDANTYPSDNEREDDIPEPPDDSWFRDQLTQMSKPKPSFTEALRRKGFQLSTTKYKEVVAVIDEVVMEKELFSDAQGGWIHELKVEQVKIVLRKRFTQIDNVCFGDDALKVVWGGKIISELISRRITSQRAKAPTSSPSKRKVLEGAKESPTKKAKWLMMPAVTLIIKDKVVPVELGSMERHIKRRIEDIGGKNIQLATLQQIVEADWPEVDMGRVGFFYKHKQRIGTEYVQIVGSDNLRNVLADMGWEMSKSEKTYVVLHLRPLAGS
jgi:hypothetical protein